MLDIRAELLEKVEFVKEISEAVTRFQRNVINIHYDIFKSKKYDNWYQEYLVVEYSGGAKSARICNGDSFSAIFMEIAKILDSGYYGEVDYYNQILIDTDNFELIAQ